MVGTREGLEGASCCHASSVPTVRFVHNCPWRPSRPVPRDTCCHACPDRGFRLQAGGRELVSASVCMLRSARASDIPAIQRVRASVKENRLVSTVITDADVRTAIEDTGHGWVVAKDGEVVAFAIGNAVTGTSGRYSSSPSTRAAAMAGSFTTRWSTGCGPLALIASG